jgi:hypothetical protein
VWASSRNLLIRKALRSETLAQKQNLRLSIPFPSNLKLSCRYYGLVMSHTFLRTR